MQYVISRVFVRLGANQKLKSAGNMSESVLKDPWPDQDFFAAVQNFFWGSAVLFNSSF
jgi:hypothetical protein